MIAVLQIVIFYRDDLNHEEISSFGFDHKLIKIGFNIYERLLGEYIPQEKLQNEKL